VAQTDRVDRDSQRSRRLLFSPELADGTVRPSQLARAEVRAAVPSRRVPSAISRRYQRMLMERGALRVEGETIARSVAARRAVLGEAAAGPPRLLVRVGTFPHPLTDEDPRRFGTDAFRRFHATLAASGLRYLVAITPRVAQRPLDPRGSDDRPLRDDELELIADLRHDGVAFGAGGLNHRTAKRAAARRTELGGLSKRALDERLEAIDAELAAIAVRPDVLVPPFDRFAWHQWDALAQRFDVVATGRGSLDSMGFHDAPLWRGDAVYLPTYVPFDGPSADVLAAVRGLDEQGAALWTGVVLDWAAETGGEDLARLVAQAAGWSSDWETFLAAVRLSAVDV
jgi:hypothetical protein